MGMRLILFALSLGLTLISFQAYSQRGSTTLQYAFIGFAFISMGTALTSLSSQVEGWDQLFQLVETVPFIVGFSMLYVSLYR
ncbi:DUF7521 family protein [Halomarina ordinaria]|uniref:Uncharacterized protein n=1 Tax=Halomarina ordinaria TaxID=3033939 RepID=A0ABD5UBD3_9EURY|nr:hypothetical protein [Halomarina sp. PSRA2]